MPNLKTHIKAKQRSQSYGPDDQRFLKQKLCRLNKLIKTDPTQHQPSKSANNKVHFTMLAQGKLQLGHFGAPGAFNGVTRMCPPGKK